MSLILLFSNASFKFSIFFLKRDWVWKDPLEDSNSVTLPVSGGGGNQGWNGGDVV